MFFTRLRFYLLGLLPVHARLARYVRVAGGYYDCGVKLWEWHRVELQKLDPVFGLQQKQLRPKYPPLIDPQQKADLLEAVGRLLEARAAWAFKRKYIP